MTRMALAVQIALIVLSALGGAALGVVIAPYLHPLATALAAVLPPTVTAVVLARAAHKRERKLQGQVDGDRARHR